AKEEVVQRVFLRSLRQLLRQGVFGFAQRGGANV
ncbi:unnamed protein product, partial [marine sediment metagenome]